MQLCVAWHLLWFVRLPRFPSSAVMRHLLMQYGRYGSGRDLPVLGSNLERQPAEADEAFVMGVELGQSQDPTAIGVLHHTRVPLETWTVNNDARTALQVRFRGADTFRFSTPLHCGFVNNGAHGIIDASETIAVNLF
jgi:hypothetical protein